jgi:hypothetical protein
LDYTAVGIRSLSRVHLTYDSMYVPGMQHGRSAEVMSMYVPGISMVGVCRGYVNVCTGHQHGRSVQRLCQCMYRVSAWSEYAEVMLMYVPGISMVSVCRGYVNVCTGYQHGRSMQRLC